MAALEGKIAPIMGDVLAAGKIRNRPQVGTLLSLGALIAARDRRARLNLSRGLSAKLKSDLASGKIDLHGWNQLRDSELRRGVHPDKVVLFDQAVRLARTAWWTPPAPHIFQVGLISEVQKLFIDLLVDRSWELIITDSSVNGGFICSDSPLVWGSLDSIDNQELKASLGEAELEITFPVSKDMALVSHPKARMGNVSPVDEVVAHVNMRTLQLGMGLVLHAHPDFLLRRQSGEIRAGCEWMAYVEEQRRRGILRP